MGQEVRVHIQVRYRPTENLFRWEMGEVGGKRITLMLAPEAFAKTIEYLELVLSDYSEAKRRGEI